MCASLNTPGDQEMSALRGMEKEDVLCSSAGTTIYNRPINHNQLLMKQIADINSDSQFQI